MGYVYCLYDFTNKLTRIGKTKNADKSRQKSQIGYSAFKLLEFTIQVNDYGNVEKQAHRHFKKFNVNGDWYKIKPDEFIQFVILNFDYKKIDVPSFRFVAQSICEISAN